MAFYNNVIAGAAGAGGDTGYKIERSLRFDEDTSSHLTRTPSTAGNRKTWTWSGWIKTTTSATYRALIEGYGGTPAGSNRTSFQLNNVGKLHILFDNGNSGQLLTSAQFRDPSSWFHVVLVVDTTQSTASNRVKIYVNGRLLESGDYDTASYPSQNYSTGINNNQPHYINRVVDPKWGDWYAADVHFLDGIAISNPDGVFGEFSADTGVWNPIEYEGNYNGAAVAGTSYSSATGAKSLYSTTNDGQTTGSGYSSGAVNSATKLIVPGFNLTEEGVSGQSISNNGATTVTSGTKYYGTALQFATSANQGSHASNSLTFSQGLGLSGADFFTLEAWVYPRSGHTQDFVIVFEGDWNNNEGLMFYLDSSRYPKITLGNGSFQSFASSQQVPYDQWTHVACVNLNNTVSFFVNGNKDTASGTRSKNYSLGNNHRLIGAYRDSNHLAGPRNPFYGYISDIRVTADSKYTSSFTVPGGGAIPAGVNGFRLDFSDDSSVAALGYDAAGSNNWTVNNIGLSQVDYTNSLTSQSLDTSVRSGSVSNIFNGDTTDKYEWNVSGTNSGDSGTFTITFSPALNVSSGLRVHAWLNDNQYDKHGISVNGGSYYYPNIYDGSNQWHDLLDTSYSNNTGFTGGTLNTLSFKTVVDMNGQNPSGWVRAIEVNGVQLTNSSIDILRDSPTNYEASSGNNGGNYATLNPLQTGSGLTLSNGNLDLDGTSSWKSSYSSIFFSSGKWYTEYTIRGITSHSYGIMVGLAGLGTNSIESEIGSSGDSYAIQNGPGDMKVNYNGTSSGQGSQAAYAVGDVLQLAWDADNGKLFFGKNGTWINSGNPVTGANAVRTKLYGTYCFAVSLLTTSDKVSANFGQLPFAYTPPTGYKSLCTTNLDDPDISNGNDQFKAVLRNGFGTGGGTVTTGFRPGLLWEKTRSTSGGHYLYDANRGVGKILFPNSAQQETNDSNLDQVDSFTNTGYTLGGNEWGTNVTLVGWAWKDGGSNVSVSAGGINSTCYNTSANWSNDASATLRTFTGNVISGSFNGKMGYNNGDEWTQVDGNNTWTFAPSGGIANVTSLRVYVYPRHGTLTFSVNGTQITSVTGNVIHKVDLSSAFSGGAASLTNLTITSVNSGSYWGMIAVEVNDKYLVDSNITPPNAPQLATTHRVNSELGMSIVTYTANRTRQDSIAHGLGKQPHFAIFKNRDSNLGTNEVDWGVYHHSLTATYYMELNQSFGRQSDDGPFYHVDPDVNRFYFGTGGGSYLTNGPAGDDFLGLIFTEVPGFSKFSVYTGSGSQQFVYCGFRPAWVMIKRYTDNTVGEWGIYDNTRAPYNEIQRKVWANNNSGEEDHPNNSIDFVSNGFVVDPGSNAPNVQYTNNGSVGYLFAAFAESPLKYARAR